MVMKSVIYEFDPVIYQSEVYVLKAVETKEEELP